MYECIELSSVLRSEEMSMTIIAVIEHLDRKQNAPYPPLMDRNVFDRPEDKKPDSLSTTSIH